MRAPTECTVLSIAAWNTAVLGLVLHSVVKVGFAVSVKNLMNQLHAWCVCVFYSGTPGQPAYVVVKLSSLFNEANEKEKFQKNV